MYLYVVGVGKSATIKAVAQQAEKILTTKGQHPNHPRVLLCAWTGKASHLIGKSYKSIIFYLSFINEIQFHNLTSVPQSKFGSKT